MKTKLYLGLNPPHEPEIYHLPIIKIVPRSLQDPEIAAALQHMPSYTHLIFTSQTAIHLLFQQFSFVPPKEVFVIGEASARILARYTEIKPKMPREATAEGMVAFLKEVLPSDAHIFWPHSALSRSILKDFFDSHHIAYTTCELYNTVPIQLAEKPVLDQFSEIIFTSPSTVDAFLLNYGELPRSIALSSIGPITKAHLAKFL